MNSQLANREDLTHASGSVAPTLRDHGVLWAEPSGLVPDEIRAALESRGWLVWAADTIEKAVLFLLEHQPMAAVLNIDGGDHHMDTVLTGIRRMSPSTALVLTANSSPTRSVAEESEVFMESNGAPEEWVLRIEEAVKMRRSIRRELDFLARADGRLLARLEWFLWKQQLLARGRGKAHGKLIKNLKHSLAQGLGPGALLTMVEMLPLISTREGSNYVVPEQTIADLCQTADRSFGWFDKIDGLMGALDRPTTPSELSHEALHSLLQRAITDVDSFRSIKGHTVSCEIPRCAGNVCVDPNGLGLVVRELLVNAFKYSPDGSGVQLTGMLSGGMVRLLLMNDILEMGGGTTGIPQHLENNVFEPFCRLNNAYDERFRDEELGMGTGLTVVENLLQQMGGSVHLGEITDHTNRSGPKRRVLATVSLPTSNPLGANAERAV